MAHMKRIITSAILTLLSFANANAAMPEESDAVMREPIAVPSGDYTLDKSHSSIAFSLSHLGFSHYTAQFKNFDAKLKLDISSFDKSTVEVTIDPMSLDLPTPPAGFKDELLGDKWLNAKAHPLITFKSTKVEYTSRIKARITGDLTLHGVTKPIVLDAVFNGGYKGIPDRDPNARAGFSAKTTFKRSDFGIAYGIPEAGSNMGVGDEVNVTIETEFTGPALTEKK